VSTQALERREDRFPDVERAARRLARPGARLALVCKRLADVVLALAMIVALAPVFALVLGLLAFAGDGLAEQRLRLGRNGRAVVLWRFHPLPGGALGRVLERAGARDLPLLFAVLRGRLSFVGPRAVPPGHAAGYTGPRRLMAPGLIGPGQRAPEDEAASLDDAYVEGWSLWLDARLLAGRPLHHRVSKSSS